MMMIRISQAHFDSPHEGGGFEKEKSLFLMTQSQRIITHIQRKSISLLNAGVEIGGRGFLF